MRIEEGQEAPDFTLPRDGGGSIGLAQLRGRPVVIFVYPQDATPTCTDEARAFSAARDAFDAAGAAVIGLSTDPVSRHDAFRDKEGLAVPLVSDEARQVIEGWGLWVEKRMYGRTYMGVERTTLLIDGDGIVRRIWRKVRVKGHVAAVLDAVRAL